MSWLTHHQASEQMACEAHRLLRQGDVGAAKSFFEKAATQEAAALGFVSPDEKPRTFAVTAVSAVALSYKAGELKEAEQIACLALSANTLLPFARNQIRELLQSIWNEQIQSASDVRFVPGQVTVSIDGGEIVRGGAPLDLIVERVQIIQSLFYRTAEFLKQLPLRRKGPATKPIQDLCRPWLFQSVPGSYQFSVAIQRPAQGDMFDPQIPEPSLVATTFMAILEHAGTESEAQLAKVVPDTDYRKTFLKLARNLAPTGKNFTQMEIRSNHNEAPIVFTQQSRKAMSRNIRGPVQEKAEAIDSGNVEIKGILRAVSLENDWLDVMVDGELIHIVGTGEAIDDVIGPMVNHPVVVHAIKKADRKLIFLDIEPDDDVV